MTPYILVECTEVSESATYVIFYLDEGSRIFCTQCSSANLHGVKPEKSAVFIVNFVKTSSQ